MKTTIPLLGAMSLLLVSCGSDGKDGARGPAGARGEAGVPGPKGDKGDNGAPGAAGPHGKDGGTGPAGKNGSNGLAGLSADGGLLSLPEGGLTASCLSPCHGFTGIVEQWKSSTHYATFIANLGGEEVPTWTGPTACGNCHAIDGVSYRANDAVGFVGTTGPVHAANGQVSYLSSVSSKITESTYTGSATVAVVHCTTCHKIDATNDPHRTGNNYTAGTFPLQAPSSSTDQAILEKSSAAGMSDGTPGGLYNRGNACIWCHKSRKDVTNYITPTNNSLSSTRWGPHEGPQSDIYTGKGGYHYTGKTYKTSSHQAFKNGCLDCHMPPVASNQGIGNHSFAPQLSTCQKSGCHATATNFDIIGQQTTMKAGIQELRVALNTAGYLTRSATAPYVALSGTDLADQAFQTDLVLPGASVSGDVAGAIYNYLLLARGAAGGVHNPVYVRELIYDSLVAITGNAPATIPSRP